MYNTNNLNNINKSFDKQCNLTHIQHNNDLYQNIMMNDYSDYNDYRDFNECNVDENYRYYYIIQDNSIFFHPNYDYDGGNKLINLINSNKIKKINFINNRKEAECVNKLEKTLNAMEFYKSKFDLYIDFSNCDSVENIKFGNCFNKTTDYKLPKKLKKIIYGHCFNLPINNLSQTLEELVFGGMFNLPIDNLPSGLKNIWFGCHFNKSVNNLPSGLETIKFGETFNQPVDFLPSGLKFITFGEMFNHPIDNLPTGLIFIEFGRNFNQTLNCLPFSIEIIDLSENIKYCKLISKIPKNLKKILINRKYIHSKEFKKKIFGIYVSKINPYELDVNGKIIKIENNKKK